MKEFSEDIESRMSKAFKSKAGKKFGLSEAEIEMRRALAPSNGFSKNRENIDEVDKKARSYMMNMNTKFLKKNILSDRL
jgi:hypothetical protein